MVKFMAIKIHYDHRPRLKPHLKYSLVPTQVEYKEYLDLYHTEGVGGEGFHECLNFHRPETGTVRMYLPPTCTPDERFLDEEFVIFSFTYKGDKEMSSHIVGVHAAAHVLAKDGITRSDVGHIEGIEYLTYHVEAPVGLVTLINPPLSYDCKDGRYTPAYQFWGYGLRYINQAHAAQIVGSALEHTSAALNTASASETEVLQGQIQVLRGIAERYFPNDVPDDAPAGAARSGSEPPPPDPEIGRLGEKVVYEEELRYVKSLGLASSRVEWISQSEPQSPFDIKSVRKQGDLVRSHFIEVKSSKKDDQINVFISSGQVEFFESHKDRATFKLVKFSRDKECIQIRELTWPELTAEFSLVPIKFRLTQKKLIGFLE